MAFVLFKDGGDANHLLSGMILQVGDPYTIIIIGI